ncbi:MAG TPA: HDOD domain-containing protein, partial [Planctomycetaceae bacterium]|nr:HDOD domain-containing protein [Planctomycetaceae bacterium]
MSQKRVVIVFLSDASKAAQLAAYFSDDEHEPLLPQNTDEFYRVVNSQCVELVIIDNQLPGFLSGIEILERLHKDLLRPTTVLIAVANSALHDRVQALQIQSVIRPTASVETIAELARSAMRAGNIAQVPINSAARRLVQSADIIRPLPQILVKYASQLDADTCSMAELAQDISVDPKTTSILLKLMNSAALAVRNRVTRVIDAVSYLGIRRTVALILSANLAHSQTRLAKTFPEALRVWYHNRSVLIASVAASFARHRGESSPDTAFVLGLLQELGIPVLAHVNGEKYLDIIRRVRDVGQLRLEIAEQQEFELTHADVSAALLQKWGLPQSLIRLVVNHHQPDSGLEMPNAERKLLQAMRIGEAVANLSDKRTAQRHQFLNQLLVQYEMDSAEEWKICLADAVAKALESSQLFSIPIPDEAKLQSLIGQLSAECSDAELPPEADEAAQEAPEAAPIDEPPQVPAEKHLLVIDDEEPIVKMISLMLQSQEVAVRSCSLAEDALQLARNAFAVLCDVHLGGVSGIEVVRSLRQQGFAGPIIMMSGDRSRSTVEE